MKRKLTFAIVIVLLLALTMIGTASTKSRPLRDGSPPYIEFIQGSFGGPWWIEGWFWVHPGQTFRIHWQTGDVRWCNKWSNDPGFTGRAHARGEYWVRHSGPNPDSEFGLYVYGLTCGNGVKPNAVHRLFVKLVPWGVHQFPKIT